jgi:hypothetical protein
MDMQDIKLGALNLITFMVSFSNIEQWLKLTLLLASIVYTVMKIINMSKQNKNG